MTETDQTRRPLQIPPCYIPYLENHNMYALFKEMTADLLIHRPEDHLQHMRNFLSNQIKGTKETYKILLLAANELKVDKVAVAKIIIKDLGCSAITRPVIMDHYEKKFKDVKCVTAMKMAEVLKELTLMEPAPKVGWILIDHPCTLNEARCMQSLGVRPTITIHLTNTPEPKLVTRPTAQAAAPRGFYDQDIEILKMCFQATRKDIVINETYPPEKIASLCFTAIRSCISGMQCMSKSLYSSGAPGVYRVVLIGCRGSGRSSQADKLAQHFNLVRIHLVDLLGVAAVRKDEVGDSLRKFGKNNKLIQEIINRRVLQKDCLELGWVMTGYSAVTTDFSILENIETPPNRLIFMNVDFPTARSRLVKRAYNYCTGKETIFDGSSSKILRHPNDNLEVIDKQLDNYFSETLPELRADAGIQTAEVDATHTPEQVHIQLRSCLMSNPLYGGLRGRHTAQ